MSPLLCYFLLHAVLTSFLFSLTFLFFQYFRKLDGSSLPDERLPFVSVLVPARNEGGKVGRCLESLARQSYPRYEVIAVDDRSTDNTGEVILKAAAQFPQIKHVSGTPTPPGWIGKCNALVTAVSHAGDSEWYLFTDADTCHTPESLRYSVSYAIENSADLISFSPVQELGSFWERVVMPVLLGSFLCGDPLNTINEKTNDRAYAYGQYILIRRKVYESVGGHARVHDQILDDISLARVVKAAGYRVMSAEGKLLYRVRMYTDLDSLWKGWTKNLYALIECNPIFLVLVIVLINWGLLLPWIHAGLVSFLWLTGSITGELPLLTVLSGLVMASMYAWYRRTCEQYIGVSRKHFFLLPLGSLTVTVLYLHSAYLVWTGNKVSWKGRQYKVHSTKAIDRENTDELQEVTPDTPAALAIPQEPRS